MRFFQGIKQGVKVFPKTSLVSGFFLQPCLSYERECSHLFVRKQIVLHHTPCSSLFYRNLDFKMTHYPNS